MEYASKICDTEMKLLSEEIPFLWNTNSEIDLFKLIARPAKTTKIINKNNNCGYSAYLQRENI